MFLSLRACTLFSFLPDFRTIYLKWDQQFKKPWNFAVLTDTDLIINFNCFLTEEFLSWKVLCFHSFLKNIHNLRENICIRSQVSCIQCTVYKSLDMDQESILIMKIIDPQNPSLQGIL